MKWTAYYMAKNAFTGKRMPVYLDETFKTRKALAAYLETLGWTEYGFNPNVMVKDTEDVREIANLVKE